MKVTGGCFCGDIRFEGVVDENRIGVCHCRDCQIFSGSAFRLSCGADPANFKFTKGAPSFFDKPTDSGRARRMAFCGRCGTHLASLPASEQDYPYVSIRIASTDQFDQITPSVEVFCKSRVKWIEPLQGSEQYAEMPDMTSFGEKK
ncbi:MAG: GFA family protein [Alphaproteobacteria bacterium]|nr:MAG: GFA family protein [Alphaproteobacteria bacterium]